MATCVAGIDQHWTAIFFDSKHYGERLSGCFLLLMVYFELVMDLIVAAPGIGQIRWYLIHVEQLCCCIEGTQSSSIKT